jgi:hypothetical protein
MARTPKLSKSVSASNLVQLGEAKLAALLLEAADWDPILKRRLRMELAAAISPADLALELDKRLDSLAESRARISWRKRPELIREAEMLRGLIMEPLLEADARLALDRLVSWFDLGGPLAARTKDPRGELQAMIEDALPDLARVANTAGVAVAAPVLADAVLTRATPWAGLIGRVADALEPALVEALLARLAPAAASATKVALLVRRLAARADAVDVWLSTFAPDDLRKPAIAAEAATRLAGAGRAAEARAALEAGAPAPPWTGRKLWGGRTPEAEPPTDAFAEAEIAVLAAEGRTDEAAEAHWMLFERTLDPAVLKAVIAGLEDFEDVVAVDRATAYARTYFDLTRALRFLMAWGALRDAAEVIVARADELNGRAEEFPLWASRLAAKWPQAAGLLLRARIKALRAMGARGEEVEALEAEAGALGA